MVYPHWLELPLSRTNFHGPIGVRAIEVRLYLFVILTYWSVCDDLHGSDHFPILIKETESSDNEQHCRWNLK